MGIVPKRLLFFFCVLRVKDLLPREFSEGGGSDKRPLINNKNLFPMSPLLSFSVAAAAVVIVRAAAFSVHFFPSAHARFVLFQVSKAPSDRIISRLSHESNRSWLM